MHKTSALEKIPEIRYDSKSSTTPKWSGSIVAESKPTRDIIWAQ
jgi:hypothetical protein